MTLRVALLVVGGLLSVGSGQWLEKTIGLPDSLTGLRNPRMMLYNPGSNTLFVGGENAVMVLDGLSNRKIACEPIDCQPPQLGACVASLVNKVYWIDYSHHQVYVLDGACGRVLTRIPVYYPWDICYSPASNKAYVAEGYYSSGITVVNCQDDSVVRRIGLGGWNEPVVCYCRRENKVYCSFIESLAVAVIDCSRDSVTRLIPVGAAQPGGLVYNSVASKVYCHASGADETLRVIDCGLDSVVNRVVLPDYVRTVAFNPTSNKVYCGFGRDSVAIICGRGDTLIRSVFAPAGWMVFDSTDNVMWCYRENSMDSLVAIDGAGDTVCGVVQLGFSPWGVCYNPARNWLYAAGDDVTVIEPQTRTVREHVLVNFTPSALCWAKAQSKLYCAGANEASVAVVGCQSNRVLGLIEVGREPTALVYDRPLARMCCSNASDSTVSIIDCVGDSVLRNVVVGGRPGLVCLDTVRHKVWCALDYGRVEVVDLRGESLTTTVLLPSGDYIGALAADPVRARVYCATYPGGYLTVLDAAGDSVLASVPVGGSASDLCLLPGANLICCATSDNDAVAVIDGATNRVVNIIPVGEEPAALFYNVRRNKLYCANAGSDDVTVIDCGSMTPVATVRVGNYPTALAYDSVGDRVFCVCTGEDTVTVIDCRRDSVVGSVAVGDHPVAIVLAATQRRMHVANRNGASLSVIRDTVRVGAEERTPLPAPRQTPGPTIVRGVLMLPPDMTEPGSANSDRVPRSVLLDAAGRKVMALKPGPNDVSALAPGVYFLRSTLDNRQSKMTKVVIQR